MQSDIQVTPPSKKMLWAGRIMSTLPVLMLLFSAVMKFLKPPEVVKGFAHLGYPESLALGLGILELACTIIYVIPRTSVLGAILLTGFSGAQSPLTCELASRTSCRLFSACSFGEGFSCVTSGCARSFLCDAKAIFP